MSLYEAVGLLRSLACERREQHHGVSEGQLAAAKDAMGIFAGPVLAALQNQQAANVLDWAADRLERAARSEETPGPIIGRGDR